MDRKTPAKLSEELAKLGYTWEYLDKWQPKVDMYWHVDQVNVAGEVVGRAGTMMPNLPGHPDHQARYAQAGSPAVATERGRASAGDAANGTGPSARAASSWHRMMWSGRWLAAGCLGVGTDQKFRKQRHNRRSPAWDFAIIGVEGR